MILQECGVAYAITDRDLRVVRVHNAVGGPWADQQECVGRSLLDVVPELVGSEAILEDILAGRAPRFQLPWVNREMPDGRILYLTMVDLPHRDRAGRIGGLVHLVQDVSEMGELQQQLTQQRNELRLLQDQLARRNLELTAANAELRRLDEVKSMFVSTAAHELRTPLAPISGYVEMLLDGDFGPLTGDQRERLRIVDDSVRRLLNLTSGLLDVARLEMGRVELLLQPTDLLALVEDIVAAYRPQLNAKAQHLTLCAPSGLPPALCDRTRAGQIIGNLLSNASKYTLPHGKISVGLVLAEEKGFLQVSVADNGVGVSAQDQSRLFERFFRAESAAVARAGGAGLGLYVARSLVELHGGRIWFESELGEGSTFYVTLPISDRPA